MFRSLQSSAPAAPRGPQRSSPRPIPLVQSPEVHPQHPLFEQDFPEDPGVTVTPPRAPVANGSGVSLYFQHLSNHRKKLSICTMSLAHRTYSLETAPMSSNCPGLMATQSSGPPQPMARNRKDITFQYLLATAHQFSGVSRSGRVSRNASDCEARKLLFAFFFCNRLSLHFSASSMVRHISSPAMEPLSILPLLAASTKSHSLSLGKDQHSPTSASGPDRLAQPRSIRCLLQ